MKTKNAEVTGKRSSSLSGWLLNCMKNATAEGWTVITFPQARDIDATVRIRNRDLKAIFASNLTQAPDKLDMKKAVQISRVIRGDIDKIPVKTFKRTKGPQPGETVRTVKARKK